MVPDQKSGHPISRVCIVSGAVHFFAPVAPGLFPHGRGGIYDAGQPGKLAGVINAASTMILEFVQKGEMHPIVSVVATSKFTIRFHKCRVIAVYEPLIFSSSDTSSYRRSR